MSTLLNPKDRKLLAGTSAKGKAYKKDIRNPRDS
jgi:hypothetical protein